MPPSQFDALVIGGGFYGTSVAEFLKRRLSSVLLVEREADLLTRASYVNQARVHGGYHYPRSVNTALRSRVNFPRFVDEFRDAIAGDFVAVYCVARHDSKVSPRYFESFFSQIGAPYRPVRQRIRGLFDSRTVAAAYEVDEVAFDAAILREIMRNRLTEAGVEIGLSRTVVGIDETADGQAHRVEFSNGELITADRVLNCTYAGLNRIRTPGGFGKRRLKHEITEIALVRVPEELRNIGITVMDGPFFSVMPFPARKLHSLTHVRYTPHISWIEGDRDEGNPYDVLAKLDEASRFPYMLRGALRYVPSLREAVLVDTLFEVKTVLTDNEVDDGRPILLERHERLPNTVSVLGSKVDNVYDIITVFDRELR
jgi:glycine/D-amino acid oxidase-like deaminating enzyme